MSGDKISVKDLAGMLRLDSQDLKTELQGMGYELKMITSSIPTADIDRVKAHLKAKGIAGVKADEDKGAPAKNSAAGSEHASAHSEDSADSRVERREVQPGLIIRRRRVKEAEEPVKTTVETPASSQTDDEESAAAPAPHTPEPEAVAEPKQKSEAVVATKKAKPKETTARIISRPEPVKPTEPAQPETRIEQEKPAAGKQNPAAETAEPVQSVQQEQTIQPVEDKEGRESRKETRQFEPNATFAPDETDIKASKETVERGLKVHVEPAALAEEKPKQEEPKKPAAFSPVRIISRPDPVPELPQPDFEQPRMNEKPSGGPRYSEPSSKTYDGERDGPKKKRNMNSRRTVDFRDFDDDGMFDLDKADLSSDWGDDLGAGGGRPQARRKPRPRKEQRQTAPQAPTQPIKAAKRKIKVDELIKVSELAHEMGVKSTEVIKVLMQLGVLATINQSLDIDTATLVASEFQYEIEKVGFSEDDYLVDSTPDNPEDLKLRPPVVTIMGHVDHGKTSLLDAIRKSQVAAGEAGGITQHIGAYHVTTPKGNIVFLDTPGHEAFTAMRARGAQMTDIVVLVVAADDGVMEQTREAVNHSQAAGVPIMVAVNKIDKEGANPERVTRELSELGLVSEEWGGDTIFVNVSAKTGQGIDELLEMIALQAEVMELKANPNKPARGHIIEAKLDKGRGPVGTVLIQEGTLHQYDVFVCGVFSGRVRAMLDDQGRNITQAGPSMPVEVHGFEGVPEAGEEFVAVADEKLARRIVDERAVRQRERELARESRVTLETFLASRPTDVETLILNLVLKTDVQGSLEAISEALKKMGTEEVRVNVVHGGAGSITESDVLLASASNAIIIGFNVRPTAKVKDLAEQEKVEIRFYDIIYNLADEIKKAMEGMLAPVITEVYLGQAEVRETFNVPKVGTIAGCFVVDGKITRNAEVRLLREGVVVYTGRAASLKRFKDDVREVVKGYECGLSLENFNDIKVGDVVEAFEHQEQAATLD